MWVVVAAWFFEGERLGQPCLMNGPFHVDPTLQHGFELDSILFEGMPHSRMCPAGGMQAGRFLTNTTTLLFSSGSCVTERSAGSERNTVGEFTFPGKYCYLVAKVAAI